MTTSKYLLYIDILGFSELVKNDYQKINRLYQFIDNLNVHRHDAFHTIVFSDTILIFNKIDPLNRHDHEYLVMYACEFVQDLLFRCIDLEVHFRAILTYGEFYYQKLVNIEAYHGKALISAYQKEKEINGLGLFIDKKLLKYNEIFPTISFDKEFDFVYLTQNIERLNFYGSKSIPLDPFLVEESQEFMHLDREVRVLKILKWNIDNQIDSGIRGKYLQTYHLYKQRYGQLIEIFEKYEFDHKIVSPNADWSKL